MFAIMKKGSLSVSSVRAGMTAAEKASVFAAFNDSGSNVDVLLLNTMVGAAGLNLHRSCNFGIQVQMPWSYGSSGQYLGRLVRLGQSQPVTWVILTVDNTAYNFLEHRACVKEVQALSAQLRFPGHLSTPFTRKLLSYEVLRTLWSQPFNRLTWEFAHPCEAQDFTSGNSRKFGRFYSLLADLLLQTDKDDLPEDHKEIIMAANTLKIALPVAYLHQLGGKELPDALTWEAVRAASDCAASDPAVKEMVKKITPDTEFGTVSKFKNTPLLGDGSDDTPVTPETPTPAPRPKRRATTEVGDASDSGGEGPSEPKRRRVEGEWAQPGDPDYEPLK
jgi:hypothetical protein